MMLQGCFVTGTDTEVGKTHVSAALLHLLGADGARTAGFKPVAAGLRLQDGRLVNDDVMMLRAASTLALTDAEVGPFQFTAACAPHLAAAAEGRAIDRAAVLRSAHDLARRCDWLVVEGVGGFRVPLGDGWDSADLAVDLGLPVLLVVGLRLGCLNHALLTAQAVQSRGLRLAGWIGNSIDRDMAHRQDNIDTLRTWLQDRHGVPCLGVVPWLADPAPAVIASCLDASTLRRTLASGQTPSPSTHTPIA